MSLLLASCTVSGAQGHGSARLYLGLVRVVTPSKTGNLSAIDAQVLGLGWDKGPFLGWKAGSWIEADPAQCQLVIIIRSAAQAENAVRVLQSLKGEQPCIADYTGALSSR